jgi:hypothetical protein
MYYHNVNLKENVKKTRASTTHQKQLLNACKGKKYIVFALFLLHA